MLLPSQNNNKCTAFLTGNILPTVSNQRQYPFLCNWIHTTRQSSHLPSKTSRRISTHILCHQDHSETSQPSSSKHEPSNQPSTNPDSSSSSTMKKAINPKAVREDLLKQLSSMINLDSQKSQIESNILALESLKSVPATIPFTEFALAGEWRLLFSSMTTRTDGNVRIREIGQSINTEKHQLINKVLWTFSAPKSLQQVNAEMIITASYQFVNSRRLDVKLDNHTAKILTRKDGQENILPDDMQAIMIELQLALPMDFFDPSGLIDITYIEPSFRLVRYVGKERAGVSNVFVRP